MNPQVLVWLPLLLVAGVLLARLFDGSNKRSPHDPEAQPAQADERKWIGPIYNDPDDPRLFVPKRFGLGTTLNFGRPLGKVLLIGTLLLAVLPLIVRALSHS